jgi:hypothetical protein
MNIRTDFLPRVKEEKHPTDKSFSYTGKGDFIESEPEIKTYQPRPIYTRPRTRRSELNSYT